MSADCGDKLNTGAAWWQLEQQLEQPARGKPQQQQP